MRLIDADSLISLVQDATIPGEEEEERIENQKRIRGAAHTICDFLDALASSGIHEDKALELQLTMLMSK